MGVTNGIRVDMKEFLKKSDFLQMIIRFIRDAFRYKITAITVLLSFSFSLVSGYYVILMFCNANNERTAKNIYSFSFSKTYVVNSLSEIPDKDETETYNLTLINVPVYYDSAGQNVMVDVVVYVDENKKPLINGRFFDETDHNDHQVVLGRERVRYAYKKDEEMYVRICGEEYHVVGIVGDENSALFDYKIYIYYKGLSEKIKNAIETQGYYGLCICYESDYFDVEKNLFPGISSIAVVNMSDGTAEPDYNEKDICVIAYLFCVLSIVVSVSTNTIQRKHEIQVLRTLGFDTGRIVVHTVKPVGLLMGLSIIIALGIITIINCVMGELVEVFRISISKEVILSMIITMLFSTFFSCVIPVCFFVKREISGLINRC